MADSSDSLWSSIVHVPSTAGDKAVHHISWALPFGATASVYAFNRLARGLWKCMTMKLSCILTQFYDDFPQLEPTQTGPSARSSVTSFLDILGIGWSSGPKDLEFAKVFQPLGVRFDLTKMSRLAEFEVSNKPSRIEAMVLDIDQVKASGKLPPAHASEMHGRLHFTESQTFGKAALPAIREIGHRSHEHGKPTALHAKLRFALDFLRSHLLTAIPRIIRACDPSRNLLVFSDGSYENLRGEWGFVICDTADGTIEVSGAQVPKELVDHWTRTVGDQIITQIELLGVFVARLFLEKRTASRKVIYWIDSDAARDSLIRGYSTSEASLSIIYQFYKFERSGPSNLWFARVPSHSNIADEPSRGAAKNVVKQFGAREVFSTIPREIIRELVDFSSLHRKL